MLDMGGYGSGARWHLDIAIDKNDFRLAEWCLAHGASATAAPARDSRFPQVSLYESAVRKGRGPIADLLVRHGATPTEVVLSDSDAFVAAAFRLDRAALRQHVIAHPELLRAPDALFAAAREGRADVVELLLDLGISPDVENAQKQRALHIAAYNNAIRVAELLIARGAEVDPVESSYGGTPLGAAGLPSARGDDRAARPAQPRCLGAHLLRQPGAVEHRARANSRSVRAPLPAARRRSCGCRRTTQRWRCRLPGCCSRMAPIPRSGTTTA